MNGLEEYYEAQQRYFDEEYTLEKAFRGVVRVWKTLNYLLSSSQIAEKLDAIEECNVPQMLAVARGRLEEALACIANIQRGTPEEGERYDGLVEWLREIRL